jgi:hypothetical protein
VEVVVLVAEEVDEWVLDAEEQVLHVDAEDLLDVEEEEDDEPVEENEDDEMCLW